MLEKFHAMRTGDDVKVANLSFFYYLSFQIATVRLRDIK